MSTHRPLSHGDSKRGASLLEVVVATVIFLSCVLGVVRMSVKSPER